MAFLGAYLTFWISDTAFVIAPLMATTALRSLYGLPAVQLSPNFAKRNRFLCSWYLTKEADLLFLLINWLILASEWRDPCVGLERWLQIVYSSRNGDAGGGFVPARPKHWFLLLELMNFSILELPKPFTVIWMASASVSDLNLLLFFKPGLISKSKPAALLPVTLRLVTVTIPLPSLSSILTSSPQRAGPLLPCVNDGSKSAYPCKLAFICQHLCTGLQLLLTPELLQKHSCFSSRASSDWYFKKKAVNLKT